MSIATVERRTLTANVEVRTGAESPVITGYAAVFDSLSETLYESDYGKFREKVAPGAFRKTLQAQNITLLIEHRDLPLGSTRAGTLELAEDSKGLRFRSVLDGSDPDVQRLIPKLKRGDMNKCSFGFVPIRETWDDSTKPPTRTLLEVRLVDISVVVRPAYSATSVSVRSLPNDAPHVDLFEHVCASVAELARATGRDETDVLDQVRATLERQHRGRRVETATLTREHREAR